jgi:starch-binding outer membrane protein, SusD/RagB family
MKNNKIFKIIAFGALLCFNTGCDEEQFLKEVPLDFYSPENSFITPGNFEAALTDLYAKVRAIQSVDGGASLYSEVLGTDVAFNARLATDRMGSYAVGLTPQSSIPTQHWLRWYKVIGNANTIISRADKATSLNDTQKKQFGAEAKFFRAFSYNKLANLFGGVPLILDEVASPKTDFVRAAKADVLKQIILDAADAAANLPAVDAVKDGKINKAAANHLLAEAYIQAKDYDKAIAAATEVIEKSNLKLMTDRFGSLRTQPGDVFYDLFRVGNQNRKGGNTEGIWVIQYENDIIGGGLTSAGGPVNNLERVVSPAVFSLVAPDGKSSLLDNLSASTLNSGGRGVSFVQPTNYWTYDIWGLDAKKDNRKLDSTITDIRTSRFNIVRDFIYTNPASLQFGKSIIDFPATNWIPVAQKWRWYPYPSKVTTPGQHPTGLYQDAAKLTLKSVAGQTYRDSYMIRLSETILLRAEAHLLKGNAAQAAADINLVRARAKAKPATAGDITLDYILDERARELIFEEDRRHTLSRMGLLVERAKKYNTLSGPTIQPFHALFPIPFSEIQANKDAVIEQNPGY